MRRKSNTSFLEWVAIVGAIASIALLVIQLAAYSNVRERLPVGMIIGGVPVGGLTRQEAQSELNVFIHRPLNCIIATRCSILTRRRSVFVWTPK